MGAVNSREVKHSPHFLIFKQFGHQPLPGEESPETGLDCAGEKWAWLQVASVGRLAALSVRLADGHWLR